MILVPVVKACIPTIKIFNLNQVPLKFTVAFLNYEPMKLELRVLLASRILKLLDEIAEKIYLFTVTKG